MHICVFAYLHIDVVGPYREELGEPSRYSHIGTRPAKSSLTYWRKSREEVKISEHIGSGSGYRLQAASYRQNLLEA